MICDKNGFKLVPMHDAILPTYALMDPDLLAGLPTGVAAATAVDAFTHALESYTNMNANDFTELFSLRALELIGEAIRPFVANPAVEKWANMMSLGSMYAGFSLGIASIGQDHVITHPMSEEPFHMPHGDACGMVPVSYTHLEPGRKRLLMINHSDREKTISFSFAEYGLPVPENVFCGKKGVWKNGVYSCFLNRHESAVAELVF